MYRLLFKCINDLKFDKTDYEISLKAGFLFFISIAFSNMH